MAWIIRGSSVNPRYFARWTQIDGGIPYAEFTEFKSSGKAFPSRETAETYVRKHWTNGSADGLTYEEVADRGDAS